MTDREIISMAVAGGVANKHTTALDLVTLAISRARNEVSLIREGLEEDSEADQQASACMARLEALGWFISQHMKVSFEKAVTQ